MAGGINPELNIGDVILTDGAYNGYCCGKIIWF
ncbi:hypothetical protein [uncultured Treponema sp.]